MKTEIILTIPITESAMHILYNMRCHTNRLEFELDDIEGAICLFGEFEEKEEPACEDCPCWDGFNAVEEIEDDMYRRGME